MFGTTQQTKVAPGLGVSDTSTWVVKGIGLNAGGVSVSDTLTWVVREV